MGGDRCLIRSHISERASASRSRNLDAAAFGLPAFSALFVLSFLSVPTPSPAQQPYVRTWEKRPNGQTQLCNNLATYIYYGRDNTDSLCSTVRQQEAYDGKDSKGYPDYSETSQECKRLGK